MFNQNFCLFNLQDAEKARVNEILNEGDNSENDVFLDGKNSLDHVRVGVCVIINN